MSSLKSLSIACALGTSFLLGCSTYSADLQTAEAPMLGTPSLQSHHWTLQKALTQQGTPDTQWQIPASSNRPARAVELNFTQDQRLSVSNLCNSVNGSYQLEGEHIKIGHLFSTMMVCNDQALMQLEKNVAQQLPKASSWKIQTPETPVLELKFDSGEVWQLQGTPTYETLYGDSTRVFLEIAPQKISCKLPASPNAQCLQVREVKYSEQGLKESSGPWMPYTGSIEAYTHQPGVRNILRIKRFTNPQASSNMTPFVDVLDLVVESEIQR